MGEVASLLWTINQRGLEASPKKALGRAHDWWEIMWVDGSFSYMSYWGSWLTVATDDDFQVNSGLANEIHMPTLYAKDSLGKSGRLHFKPASGDWRFMQTLDIPEVLSMEEMETIATEKGAAEKQKREAKKDAQAASEARSK